ncbi:MAG: hypothetical protein WD042_08000 [Phycisphaeraceae bacterium]
MTLERDNLKAGLFVLVGIVLTMAVILTFADLSYFFLSTQDVKVSYSLSDGVQGIKPGATVTLGDQPVGGVTSVDDAPPDALGRIVGKIVTFEIPQHYKLFDDAVIEIIAPPLGSGARLNIRSVGENNPYHPDHVIEGSLPGSPLARSMLREAGIGDRQRQQLQQTIANLEAVTTSLKQDWPKVSAVLDDVQTIATTMKQDIPKLTTDARDTVAKLKDTADRANQVVRAVQDRSKIWLERIDSVTKSSNEALATVRDLVKDKDPQLRGTIDNLHQITQTARETTMTQVNDAVTKANDALGNLRDMSVQARDLLQSQRPVLERTLAAAQITAGQLQLAGIEIRRSPWRLLYRPTTLELESDNLYDAARSFAMAASSLDAAAASLQAVASDPNADKAQLQAMTEHLQALFQRYQQVENDFWKALGDPTPKKVKQPQR